MFTAFNFRMKQEKNNTFFIKKNLNHPNRTTHFLSFLLQRVLFLTTVFVTEDFAVKSNFMLLRNCIYMDPSTA